MVDLTFTSDGSRVWGKYTADNVGQRVAFAVDTRVLSAPRINSALLGGTTSITGNFTENEARNFAAALNHQ